MSSELPPIYSPESIDDHISDEESSEPQILIVPTANSVHFQKGYLGADNEHATIEGELRVKGAGGDCWAKVTICLRTTESANQHEVELALSESLLYSASDLSAQSPSTYLFSIPLPPDTPQCIHTSRSSVAHTLTANLYSSPDRPPALSKSVAVHIRRYTSHLYILEPAPETKVLDSPTRVEVQVPRTNFKAGEPLPLYITVPTPRRELVAEEGIRLRSVRAELRRVVDVSGGGSKGDVTNADADSKEPPVTSTATAQKKIDASASSSQGLDFRSSTSLHGESTIVALSGASCRLHPSRPIRIRLVLHQRVTSVPAVSQELLPEDLDALADCASISEETLFHSVSYQLRVHATFMNMTSHTERVSTITIPIVMLPPSATLPEVEESVDVAYHKKHDRPPARTIRLDDADVPHYEEGEAGPSFLTRGAPPPFEEREAPPPFSHEAEASTSTRLPTFAESETEIYVHSDDASSDIHIPPALPESVFDGEGVLFGFSPSEQFDGFPDDPGRSDTPPPTLEMATQDADVTGLANLDGNTAMEALELALDQHDDTDDHPPPPPPMDDPSDPPPSIDSVFRAPGDSHPISPPITTTQSSLTSFTPSADQVVHPDATTPQITSHGHAPPPYRVPDGDVEHEHEHVVRPPPYVDLIPAQNQ